MAVPTRNAEMDKIALRFCSFVCQWLAEANHWHTNGQYKTHEQNLRVAVDHLLAQTQEVASTANDTFNSRETNLVQLALTFPSLSAAPVLQISDHPEVLAAWAMQKNTVTQHSVRFIFAVAGVHSNLGEFQFVDAYLAWDKFHRDAFMLWLYSAG